jgi:hypothetical protein
VEAWRSPGGPGRGKHADFLGLDLDLRQLAGEWYEGRACRPAAAASLAGPPAALPPDSVEVEHADRLAATSRAMGKQLRETAALEVSGLAQAFHAYSLNDAILILSAQHR